QIILDGMGHEPDDGGQGSVARRPTGEEGFPEPQAVTIGPYPRAAVPLAVAVEQQQQRDGPQDHTPEDEHGPAPPLGQAGTNPAGRREEEQDTELEFDEAESAAARGGRRGG